MASVWLKDRFPYCVSNLKSSIVMFIVQRANWNHISWALLLIGYFFLVDKQPTVLRADSKFVRSANERRRYFVTTSLIGWAQT